MAVDIAWERRVMRRRHIVFFVVVIILIGVVGTIFYREHTKEWMAYQRTYYAKLAKRLNRPELAATPLKVNQIWIPELNVRDRCTTCHLGMENPLFKNEPQPFTTHPGDYLRNHPVNKFGCTICHQGDGQAVTVEATHGFVEHLDHQLLAGDFVQISCVKCHVDLRDDSLTDPNAVKEVKTLITGRKLSFQYGCRGCHTINGVGGHVGPELTGLGSKTELAFALIHDFQYVEGPHTMAQWIYEHFLNPQKIVPGNPELNYAPTIMPNFGFTPEQARALTIYVLSLRDPKVDNIPYKYIAKKPLVKKVRHTKK